MLRKRTILSNEKLCLMSQLTLQGNISLRQKIETESACELFHMSVYSLASYAGVKYSRTSIWQSSI